MNAREMFEELRYKRNVEDEKITYLQKFGSGYFKITFDLSKKEIGIDSNMSLEIEDDLFGAINQQVKELGWLEEEKQEEKKENNFEHFKEEITNLDFSFAVRNGKVVPCEDCPCKECYFKRDTCGCNKFKIKWLYEQCEKKYKLSQFEFDLLRTNNASYHNKLKDFATYENLREIGYFKDIDFNLTVNEILNNCEVV